MSDSSSESTHTAENQDGDNGNVTKRRKQKVRVSTAPSVISSVNGYSLRVPPFCPEEPEIWFALLEGQFAAHNITDDAIKFTSAITNLDIPTSKAVKDIILKPPAQNRYEKIKSELIKRLSASQEKKVRQLLVHEKLGDRKPSQFLRHLQDLAGLSAPVDFIRTIWCDRLPKHIQTVLASQSTHSLEQLADLADRIQDITSPCNVAAVATSSNASHVSPFNEIAELKKMVELLTLKLEEHTRSAQCSSIRSRPKRRTSASRQRSRSNSSYRKYPICWYHSKFGAQAHSCITPCDFKKTGNAAGSR